MKRAFSPVWRNWIQKKPSAPSRQLPAKNRASDRGPHILHLIARSRSSMRRSTTRFGPRLSSISANSSRGNSLPFWRTNRNSATRTRAKTCSLLTTKSMPVWRPWRASTACSAAWPMWSLFCRKKSASSTICCPFRSNPFSITELNQSQRRTRNMLRLMFIFVTAVAMATTAAAQAGTWQIDPNHTAAQFSVRHLGVSTVRGAFTRVTGSAKYDPADPSKDSLEANIDANSVDTRVEMRDNDLRSPHFLEVQKYPTITFHSKQTKVAGPGKLSITGDLTIHGVTKEVVLDMDGPSAAIKDPWGNQRIGASATTKIIRQDFGVSFMPGVVGDEITITIDAELIQPPAK